LKTGVISFLVLTECIAGALDTPNVIATDVLPNPVGAFKINTLEVLSNSSQVLKVSLCPGLKES
ncbi:MAG: hypothetical protein QXQ23_03045, partial [Sulfolobales archaeon]